MATAAIAQTPSATPQATPIGTPATPAGTPSASPVASPVATPVPDYPLDIFNERDLPDDGEPVPGGTLRLPVGRIGLLEFVPTTQRQDPQLTWSYLDALVRIDPETGTPAPSLASSWKWSQDGLKLTFTLRDDVTWHDGTPFTSEDARFTHIAYRDDYRSVIAGQSGLVADVVAVDNTSIEVQFDAPDGAWLFNVASLPVFQAAQYAAWWEANPIGERTLEGITFDDAKPVGTGPWVIEDIGPEVISLKRNAAYFQTPPHADRLELVVTPESDARVSQWQAGELDVVGQLDPQRVEELLYDTGRLIVSNAARTLFAAYNFDNPNRWEPVVLAYPELREAISLTLDRERYAQEIWGGFLRWEQAGIVAQRWVDDASRKNPKRDVKRAKQLLKDLGWRDATGDGLLDSPMGDTFQLTAVVIDTAEPAVIETLQAMDADLREIGGAIDVNVVSADEFVAWWSEDHTWDLLVYDLRLYPAFTEFDLIGTDWNVRTNPAGWNPGGYSNADADAAIQAYFAAVDEKGMAAALADLQDAIVEDPFALWLGFPQDLSLLAPRVKGFVPNPIWPTLDTRMMWIEDE